MSGVIVSVKGRYAVLLTKNSDFIKVKNKNYSVGDKVKIPQYKANPCGCDKLYCCVRRYKFIFCACKNICTRR